MTFRDEDEAVRIANSVPFGLTGAVWTSDVRRAHRVARNLEAGYIWINGSARHFWGVPFGGFKDSGIGREESLEELQSFTQVKAVSVILG
jgi:2-formylbenzoate dehydrogenase